MSNSGIEYSFGVTANHLVQANDVSDDQSGVVSVWRKVTAVIEVSGGSMHLYMQGAINVRDFYPVYDPLLGTSHAYGRIEAVLEDEEDTETPPLWVGGVIAAQAVSSSFQETAEVPPGKYRLRILIEDGVQIRSDKNVLPKVTEAKNDVDYTVQLMFTPVGGNEL